MRIAPSELLFAAILAAFLTPAAAAADAVLRCDPAVVIEKVDGTSNYFMANQGPAFRDCSVALSAGAHSIEVCFDASRQSFNAGILLKCDKARTVAVDAKAGHSYRVKLHVARDAWSTWIADVTEAEAGLSYDEPVKKPRPKGSKKDLETVLVLRSTPSEAWMMHAKGRVIGKWFTYSGLTSLRSKGQSTRGVPDGYHIMRVTAGDTVAMTGGRMMVGSMFVAKNISPCGNFPLRVYEDIPAGKVLYLGNFTLTEIPGGYTAEYVDDLEVARAYLATHEPELAGRLETAPYRVLGTTDFCYGYPGEMPGLPVSSDGAAAGLK